MFYIMRVCFSGTFVLCIVPEISSELDKGHMKTRTSLSIISILVEDQEVALHFYTEKLGLEKRADVTYAPGMRWVTVAPKCQRKPEIALARLDVALQGASVKQQNRGWAEEQGISGVFDTEDCCKMYSILLGRGVKFLRPPTKQLYGVEAVFADPYGNLFSLLEPVPEAYSMFKIARIGTAA